MQNVWSLARLAQSKPKYVAGPSSCSSSSSFPPSSSIPPWCLLLYGYASIGVLRCLHSWKGPRLGKADVVKDRTSAKKWEPVETKPRMVHVEELEKQAGGAGGTTGNNADVSAIMSEF